MEKWHQQVQFVLVQLGAVFNSLCILNTPASVVCFSLAGGCLYAYWVFSSGCSVASSLYSPCCYSYTLFSAKQVNYALYLRHVSRRCSRRSSLNGWKWSRVCVRGRLRFSHRVHNNTAPSATTNTIGWSVERSLSSCSRYGTGSERSSTPCLVSTSHPRNWLPPSIDDTVAGRSTAKNAAYA